MMKKKNILIIFGIVLCVFVYMRYLLPISSPFLIGWILALIVYPLSAKICQTGFGKKIHLSMGIAGSVLILGIIVLLAGVFWVILKSFTEQISALLTYFPTIERGIEQFIADCCCTLERFTGVMAADSSNFIYDQIDQVKSSLFSGIRPDNMMVHAVSSVKGCIVVFSAILLSAISGMLLVKDFEIYRDKLGRYLFFSKFWNVLKDLMTGAREYLKSQVKIMAIVIVICIIGFYFLGNSHFLIVGFLVGIVDALPILGTGTVLIPWALIVLLQGKTGLAVGYVLLYLAASISRQFLEPKLIGKSLGIYPIFVLASVYFGVFVYGGAGFLLGPLSVMIILGLIREWGLWEDVN